MSCSKRAAGIPRLVADAIAAQFGFEAPVILRKREELADIVESNPFVKPDADLQSLHLAFLADPPRPGGALDPGRSPGDSFALRGRELYLHLPNGVARTKLTNAYLDSSLGCTTTARNWRTVVNLLALAMASK